MILNVLLPILATSQAALAATNIPYDVFSYYGRSLIENAHTSQKSNLPAKHVALSQALQGRLPNTTCNSSTEFPIGILGAGMAGLYTALILDDLGLPYEILEADSTRIGGRIYTHQFDPSKEFEYFDVGAMRFPLPQPGTHGVMSRVEHLFHYPPLNTGGNLALASKLIPYYYRAVNGTGRMYFNEVHSTVNANPPSQFDAQAMDVPQPYINAGVSKILNDAIGPLAEALFNDINTGTTAGWQRMQQLDPHSTRSYLAFNYTPSAKFAQQYQLPETPLDVDTINWAETFDKSTQWYDRALTETVLEAVAFGDVPGVTVDWKCLRGGSRQLPYTIKAYLDSRSPGSIKQGVQVAKIAPTDPGSTSSPLKVTSTTGEAYTYSHVISTIPLPVMRTLDLTQAGLSIMQSNALRQLQYGPSIKIGIQFTEPWWTTGVDKDGKPIGIVGGQSFTDLPIRTVVYPSYGVNTPGSAPSNVLIASYCWTNDAERMGNLINAGADELLKDLVLRNLATVHNVDYKYLKDRLVAVYPWDWNHNSLTMGAFAFFGPGNYLKLYESLSVPASNGRLHFAGEAISVRHAWVVGALDSAWVAVHNYLIMTHASQDTLNKFYNNWGINWEWTKSGAESKNNNGTLAHEDNLLLEHLIIHRSDLFSGA